MRTSNEPAPSRPASTRLDVHVHLVGNGRGGSGCWLRITPSHRLLVRLMQRHIGLDCSLDSPDFDDAYLQCLLEHIRASSMGAVLLLAQEQPYDASGHVMEGMGSSYVPNDYVLRLARVYKELLPAVSIHPARADALDELDKCISAGALMMKCLPNCQNIECNNPRYTRFWERMAEAGIPLLAHTGGEHTLPVIRPDLADPRILELPLKCGVTVIAAHCATKSGLNDPEYFHVLKDMMTRHPNLYGDTSAFNVPLRGRHTRQCVQEPLASRLVHGSDFPVPVHGVWAWLRGFIRWSDYRRCAKIPSVIERDYQLKRAMGFTEDHFTRIGSLLRQTP